MYRNDYQKSRSKELAFERHLQVKYSCLTETTDPNSYFGDWDISSTATSHNNKITTFEVKLNSNYKTNEVCIETCRIIHEETHPAGLSATKANYYVLTFENDSNFYIIPTEKLKELVANTTALNKRTIFDANGYKLVFFNKPYLLQFCKAI